MRPWRRGFPANTAALSLIASATGESSKVKERAVEAQY